MRKERLKSCIYVYIFVFLLYGLSERIVPVVQLYYSYTTYINFILMFAGGILLLWMLYENLNIYFLKDNIILIIFIICIGISSVVNLKMGIFGNIKQIIWTSIQLLVFYNYAKLLKKEEFIEKFERAINVITVIWSCFVLFSFYQFVMDIGYRTRLGKDSLRQGIYSGRLFGVFTDPNYAAMISLAIIILLTYFMCVKRKVKYFPVQLVFMLIQGIYIILSGSRTIMLCMVIFSVFLGNIILNIAMPYKAKDVLKKEVLVRIVVSVVSAVVMLGLILGMKNGIVKLNWMLNNGYSHHKEIVGEEEEEDDEILERNDVGEGNMSNGRIDIWKSYIECSKDSIIWGASPANALKHAQMIKPKGFLTKRPYEPHNGYLAIYVNTGIVGSCIMLIFIISILLNLKEYIKAKGLKDNEFLVLTSFVASYAFYAVFFYEIFFKNNFTSVIFWLMLGFYNVFLIKQKNEKEIW